MSRPLPKLLGGVLLALVLSAIFAGAAQSATRAQAIVAFARVELSKGVREVPDGSNKAPAIRRYVASTSPSWFGAPWCAYFVSYVAKRAGVPIGPGGRGMGYVPYIVSWAKRTRRWKARPRPGYLVTWPNHIGIVETVSSNGTMTTIEGNASNAVRRRYRRTGDAQGFVALAAGGRITPNAIKRPKATPKRDTRPLKARITLYPRATLKVGERLELSANDSSGAFERVRWDLDADGRFDDARGDTATMKVIRAGRFRVAVRISNAAGKHATAQATVTVQGPSAPTARLRVKDETTVGETITADASGSRDPARKGLTYEWDIDGDGTFAAGAVTQEITFAEPGARQIAVRVTAGDGQVDESTSMVTVLPAKVPAVTLSCAQPSVPTGQGVQCTADTSASTSRISRVEWDTDSDDSWGRAPATRTLTFTTPGRRELRVRVTDTAGKQAAAATVLDVTNRAPVVAVKAPATARAETTLTLDASGSKDPDGKIAGIRWDVGADGTWDGEGTKLPLQPTAVGPLQVVVEVRDDLDAVTSTTITIDVREPLRAMVEVLTADPRTYQEVLLTARGSTSAVALSRCLWDWTGDGRIDFTSYDCSATVKTSYRKTGTKTVSLTVVDADGLRSTVTTTLVVR